VTLGLFSSDECQEEAFKRNNQTKSILSLLRIQ
jgi:hypothetical protein